MNEKYQQVYKSPQLNKNNNHYDKESNSLCSHPDCDMEGPPRPSINHHLHEEMEKPQRQDTNHLWLCLPGNV